MTTARPVSVAYFQATLGHAHLARVRALNALPGISCVGVQFAASERTRGTGAVESGDVRTLMPGVYEEQRRSALVRSALRAARELRVEAAIIDCPADVVQFVAGRLLQRAGIATLVRWASTRDDYPRRAWRELAKQPVYRGWDGYLATGERALDYLLSFGVNPAHAVVCGNPVAHDRFGLLSGEAPNSPRDSFLFVGRFIWHKNLARLLDAFALYRARGGRFVLRIAGDGSGSEAARLRECIRGVHGATHLGFLSAEALSCEYERTACLVLPSISENWGLVVNEALHARLPVIVSTRCGCVPELVRDGVSGILVDPACVESIASALARIEDLGPAARAAMGQRGRELVDRQTLGRWAAETVTCVRAAVARRRLD